MYHVVLKIISDKSQIRCTWSYILSCLCLWIILNFWLYCSYMVIIIPALLLYQWSMIHIEHTSKVVVISEHFYPKKFHLEYTRWVWEQSLLLMFTYNMQLMIRDKSILLLFSPIFLPGNSFLSYLLCSRFCLNFQYFAKS